VTPARARAIRHEEIVLHGHRVSYRAAGEGPVIALVHGIAGSSEQWEPAMRVLAERFTVVAPDLLGHGRSAKPRGDYSLGAYASGLRDLLAALGHDRGTILGHSLGGGVAMQMAYQFPERCERLVLVSSGGLGREVHFLLRAAALPGSEFVLPVLAANRIINAGASLGGVLRRFGIRTGPDVEEMWRSFSSLGDVEARHAFIQSLRGVIDPRGQRVAASDRLYLAQRIPTMLIWGERDPIIPVRHGRAAHDMIPGSRFEVFPDAGHFPYRDQPRRFIKTLSDFIDTTEPADVSDADFRDLLREGTD
jgi:pimeloyl-ACP methyl ester carboxylesterase